jgi:hypothetical protein
MIRTLASAALVVLLAGCTAAQPPVPTAAPTPAPVAPATVAPAGAAAAQNPNIVSGTVDTINGRSLSVSTNTGAKPVQLAENATIEQEGRGSVSDLMPGQGVGVTGKPDANNAITAVSIRIFPAALGTPRPGQFPMNGANQGNIMTNSTIESFDGSKLVLSSGGQRFEIGVPSNTEVLKQVPANLNALAPGVRVLAAGTPGADGTLQATSISIMGPPPQ